MNAQTTATLAPVAVNELDTVEGGIWPALVIGGLITLYCAYKNSNP
ncbi:MAG: hypothetical protein U0746_21595 [Gemmataceae bacterium]